MYPPAGRVASNASGEGLNCEMNVNLRPSPGLRARPSRKREGALRLELATHE